MALGVRKDVAGPFGADGDYCPPQYDATGALRVAATLGASFAEDSAHTTGDDGTQILCVRKDARGTNVDTDGDYASMLQNANGEAYVHDTDVATVLGTMDTKMAALGTAVMVGSSPVTIATDDTMFVALDTAVDIIAGDTTSMDTKMPALGVAVSAASSPVVLASDDAHLGAVGISADPDGPIHAQLHSIATACSATSGNTETMDDWDEDNRCKSNPIVGQAGVAANRGTADALTQRVAQARDLSVTTATGAGAIATTTSVSANWKLNNITVHLSAAPTTSQDLDISIDANDGAAYDTILLSQDLAASSATDLVYKPVGGLLLESGDEIKVAYTNSDGGTFGLRIVGEKI